eukprot:2817976-Rhodomonas_salina.3
MAALLREMRGFLGSAGGLTWIAAAPPHATQELLSVAEKIEAITDALESRQLKAMRQVQRIAGAWTEMDHAAVMDSAQPEVTLNLAVYH